MQELKGDTKVTSQNPEGTSEALSKYARDLTAAAAEGKLDPVSHPLAFPPPLHKSRFILKALLHSLGSPERGALREIGDH